MDAASSGDGCKLWPKGVRKLVSSTHLDFLGDPIQMTKTTLLAAASAAVVLFAGAAHAGTITAQVNGIATGGANPAYTIAKERTDAADSTLAGNFVTTLALASGDTPLVQTAGSANVYEVTFTISGGAFADGITDVPVAGVTDVGGASTQSWQLISRTNNQVVARLTLTANAAAGATTQLNSVSFGAGSVRVTNSADEANIAFSASINDVGPVGGSLVRTISSGNATLVRYVEAVRAFSVTSNTKRAALPNFKTFVAGDAVASTNNLQAEVASNYKVDEDNTGLVFRTGLGSNTTVTRDGIIDGAKVVVSGPALANDKVTAALVNAAGTSLVAPTRSGNTATFTLNNANADAFSGGTVDLRLIQTGTAADQAALATGQLTTAWTPIYAAGFTAPTSAATVNSGVVTLDGTNFIAPWFSGSQAQTQSQLRLSNTSARPATAHVRITSLRFGPGGSNFYAGTHACATGPFTVPAGNELVVDTAKITACFGDFARGDLLVTVEAEQGEITAKVRNTSVNGNFETSLGRYDGGSVAPN